MAEQNVSTTLLSVRRQTAAGGQRPARAREPDFPITT